MNRNPFANLAELQCCEDRDQVILRVRVRSELLVQTILFLLMGILLILGWLFLRSSMPQVISVGSLLLGLLFLLTSGFFFMARRHRDDQDILTYSKSKKTFASVSGNFKGKQLSKLTSQHLELSHAEEQYAYQLFADGETELLYLPQNALDNGAEQFCELTGIRHERH